MKDIFYDGKIYVAYPAHELNERVIDDLLAKCTSYPVQGTHNFKDRQEVVYDVDYHFKEVPECVGWHNGWETVAVPLPTNEPSSGEEVQQDKSAAEKAKELVDQFIQYCDYEIGKIEQQKYNAKQCALICVEREITLLQILLTYPELKNNFFIVDEINDLQQIKSEIEKL